MDGRRGLVRQESRKKVARVKEIMGVKKLTYTEIITVYKDIILHMKQTMSQLTNWTAYNDGVSTNPEVRNALEDRETRGTPVRTSFDMI
jgi:hypothetical protein